MFDTLNKNTLNPKIGHKIRSITRWWDPIHFRKNAINHGPKIQTLIQGFCETIIDIIAGHCLKAIFPPTPGSVYMKSEIFLPHSAWWTKSWLIHKWSQCFNTSISHHGLLSRLHAPQYQITHLQLLSCNSSSQQTLSSYLKLYLHLQKEKPEKQADNKRLHVTFFRIGLLQYCWVRVIIKLFPCCGRNKNSHKNQKVKNHTGITWKKSGEALTCLLNLSCLLLIEIIGITSSFMTTTTMLAFLNIKK